MGEEQGASDKSDRAVVNGAGERWLPCPDYEGLYEVSIFGGIRNADGHELALHPDRTGYLFVGLTKDGKRTSKAVHRLVCRAFHGESKPPHREASHLDGDRTNNRAANLKWVGKVQNEYHKRAHGTHGAGERHPRAKLSRDTVAEIRASRGLRGEIATKHGISKDTVTDIRAGRRWKEKS